MIKTIMIIAFFMVSFCGSSQSIAPTLGVGLETLTMNKGTIDVKVLTEIISSKQKELKQEALRRFMYKLFPEANYTTKFYIQNCLNVLLNEKNPKVIEKEVLKLTTNYALALGVTYALIKSDTKKNMFGKINTSYIDNMTLSTYYKKNTSINCNESKVTKLQNELNVIKKEVKTTEELEKKFNSIERKNRRIIRKKIRYNIQNNNFEKNNTLKVPFGILLDVVSLSLSNIEELRTRGFYTTKIDYRTDSFYQNLQTENEKNFQRDLISLNDSISATIKPYIVSYDVIKEFLQNKDNNIDNTDEIKEYLQNKLSIELNQILSTYLTNSNYLNVLKTEIKSLDNKNLKNIISSLETPEIRTNLQTEINKISEKLYTSITNTNQILDFKNLNQYIEKYSAYHSTKILPFTNIVLNKIYPLKYNTAEDSILNIKINKRKSLNDLLEIQSDSKNITINKSSLDSLQKQTESLKELETRLSKINDILKKSSEAFLKKQDSLYKGIVKDKVFYNYQINIVTNEILSEITNLNAINFDSIKNDTLATNKLITFFPELYAKLKKLSANELKLTELNELENYVTSNIIILKIIDKENSEKLYSRILNKIQFLITIRKYKIVDTTIGLKTYNSELSNVFEFISNLDKLNKATTYQSLVDMLKNGSDAVEENLPNDKFRDEYILFINAVKKYTIINPDAEKEYITIDVASFLNDLQQFYNRDNRSRFGLYLTLGVSENFFFKDFTFPDATSDTINNIGFASEKIGLKFKISDFKHNRGYENAIIDDVYLNKKAPFLNEFYGIIYGSGLLYTLANTSTDKNFDFPHVGGGLGIRFYNALDLNIIVGFPFVKDVSFGKNAFWGIGLDIPLGEYLEKIGNKN